MNTFFLKLFLYLNHYSIKKIDLKIKHRTIHINLYNEFFKNANLLKILPFEENVGTC